jgi:hypothetical protein
MEERRFRRPGAEAAEQMLLNRRAVEPVDQLLVRGSGVRLLFTAAGRWDITAPGTPASGLLSI